MERSLPPGNRLAETLRLLGARRMYLGVAKIFGDRPLPDCPGGVAGGWSQQDLEDTRSSARFYAVGNFLRFLFNLPVLLLAWTEGIWALCAALSILLLIHLTLVFVESYRLSLARALLPDAASDRSKLESPPDPDTSIFRTRAFETAEFYRKIGIAFIVDGFRRYGRFSSGRDEPERKMAPEDFWELELRSRTSERVHLALGALQILFIAFCLEYQPPALAGPALLLCGDIAMVLLQRYHRSRLSVLLRRARRGR